MSLETVVSLPVTGLVTVSPGVLVVEGSGADQLADADSKIKLTDSEQRSRKWRNPEESSLDVELRAVIFDLKSTLRMLNPFFFKVT